MKHIWIYIHINFIIYDLKYKIQIIITIKFYLIIFCKLKHIYHCSGIMYKFFKADHRCISIRIKGGKKKKRFKVFCKKGEQSSKEYFYMIALHTKYIQIISNVSLH